MARVVTIVAAVAVAVFCSTIPSLGQAHDERGGKGPPVEGSEDSQAKSNAKRLVDVDKELEHLRRDVDEQVSRILKHMEWFMAGLGLMLLVSAGFAFYETRNLIKLSHLAEGNVKSAQTARTEIEATAKYAVERKEDIAYAVRQAQEIRRVTTALIDPIFDRLPFEEQPPLLLGVPAPPFPPLVEQGFADADLLLTLCDRLGWLGDTTTAAKRFTSIAKYLGAKGEYSRAQARLLRAIELEPSRADAHEELGRVLSYYAAEARLSAREKRLALDEAGKHVREAASLRGGEDAISLHDLAWILHESGDYASAIESYRKAKLLTTLKDQAGISYNLACALAKGGEQTLALTELEAIPSGHRLWQAADRDPELDSLRAAPWRSRLTALIDARKDQSAAMA